MKIIVCIKQLCYTYARTGRDVESLYLDTQDSIYRINPYDEAALEMALQLKDRMDSADVVLLTLGPLIAEGELRRCLAAGADQLCRIADSGPSPENDLWMQPDPWTKADLLADAIQELRGELILCGMKSVDRGSGQIGALIARILNAPFVSAITELSVGDSAEWLRVQRGEGRGVREILQCPAPAVFSADLGPELRLPTYARRQWADAYPIRDMTHPTGKRPARLQTLRVAAPRPRTKIVPAPDSRLPAYDRICQLLAGSNVEKKGTLLTGDLESQVDGVINYLKLNGFLETTDV